MIIDVNAATLWLYRSAPYLSDIEKLYFGGASKDNSGFIGCNAETVLHFDKPLDVESIVTLLKECNYTKIHIDENCIVGWAMSFYKAVPMARKEDFLGDDTGKHKTIGEIRKPVHFERYIYPYTGQTNVKFNYLMDKLNDTFRKRTWGHFTRTSCMPKSPLNWCGLQSPVFPPEMTISFLTGAPEQETLKRFDRRGTFTLCCFNSRIL